MYYTNSTAFPSSFGIPSGFLEAFGSSYRITPDPTLYMAVLKVSQAFFIEQMFPFETGTFFLERLCFDEDHQLRQDQPYYGTSLT